MSKFFQGSDSDTDSTTSEEEIVQQRPQVTRTAFQFSDDEEEGKRIVRSAKDKHFDELKAIIATTKNHKKIKDMSNVLSDFEELTRTFDKAKTKKVIESEGIPGFYIRTLVELEDFVNECWEDREGRKAMSKNNSKGLTTLKQKLRKYIRDYEAPMTKFRENPDEFDKEQEQDRDDDEDSDDDDDDDDDGMNAASFMKPEKKVKADIKSKLIVGDSDDDFDDDDYWPASSSSSSDEEEDTPRTLTAAYFLKKAGDEGISKKDKKEKKEKKAKRREDDDDGWKEVKGGIPLTQEKPKMFSKDQEINHEAVMKKLVEIVAARGKKSTDRSEQIDLLKELFDIAEAADLGPAISCKILFNIVSAIFDYNPNIATCMKAETWDNCLNYISQLLEILVQNTDIAAGENILEESEIVDTSPYRVRGCILTVIERMNKEFTKMLQACDAHSTDYVERLRDEPKVCEIIERLQKYLEDSERSTSDDLCRIFLRRIEHIYYKFDHKSIDDMSYNEREDSSQSIMDKLCKFIYAKDITDRLRTWAMLCHIYHHAIHDRWYLARDLMLMSHLQDSITHSDVPTQILYNRTMVQLGLCAFRQGSTKDAHNCLVDIQSSNRAKELLAQGLLLQRQHERTPEQEKIEKRRLLPYHMHINLELLECVYLVSAMLMEIPYMAAHEMDARKRMISKNFHHVLRMSERQTLTGPPESMREHVVAASKAMKTGDWKSCKNFIINEKMNMKVWDLFYSADKVRDMITQKIQEESLRTYLFTYSSVYDSLSLDLLSEMFQLEKPVVHSIISKMIINEELMASLDEPTQTVVMHRTEPSRLQSLALQLSEKVSILVDNNERLMELKQGNLFFQRKGGDGQSGGYQQQNQQQWGRSGYDKSKRGYDGNRRQQRNRDQRAY